MSVCLVMVGPSVFEAFVLTFLTYLDNLFHLLPLSNRRVHRKPDSSQEVIRFDK